MGCASSSEQGQTHNSGSSAHHRAYEPEPEPVKSSANFDSDDENDYSTPQRQRRPSSGGQTGEKDTTSGEQTQLGISNSSLGSEPPGSTPSHNNQTPISKNLRKKRSTLITSPVMAQKLNGSSCSAGLSHPDGATPQEKAAIRSRKERHTADGNEVEDDDIMLEEATDIGSGSFSNHGGSQGGSFAARPAGGRPLQHANSILADMVGKR